jgi:O-acetyl-ADP-ribose deacetylase (regulator of RNase III)
MSEVVAEREFPGGRRVRVCHGDLTEEVVDAIVNAANEQLQHGGGVAGAIVRRGGAEIQKESDAWVLSHGPASHARPAVTGAGRLPARVVIHAVGPVWGSGNDDDKLRTAYTAALETASLAGYHSVAFPSISTGIFGFPVDRAAPIALAAVEQFWRDHPTTSVTDVHFTLIDRPTVDVFAGALSGRR